MKITLIILNQLLLTFVWFSCSAVETQAKNKSVASEHSSKQDEKTAGEDTGSDSAGYSEPSVVSVSGESVKLPVKDNQIIKKPQIIKFSWCPEKKVSASYLMDDEADMHSIIIPAGVKEGDILPVVIGFHGQPKREKSPKDYIFLRKVRSVVERLIENGEIEPVILVLPVFRYKGGNWPWFNPVKFKQKVVDVIKNKSEVKGIVTGQWSAFGHSGAAGCGGGGLNQIDLINPDAVGFFDTCLGDGWQKAVKKLHKKKIKTINIFSVETAGFRPRQHPEYQAMFDFGRAFSPLGIDPVKCPVLHPGKKLRTLEHRCSATDDGIVKAFVIDTGIGVKAHKAVVEPAVEYFLKEFCKFKK